jgi:hypothetical protein
MRVLVEEINQVLSLLDGAMKTRVTLKLPSGALISAQVEKDALEELLKEANLVPRETEPALEEQGEAESPDENLVEWAAVSDEYLAPELKQMLAELGAAPVMPMQDLIALVTEIRQANGLMEQAVPEPTQPDPAPGYAPAPVQPYPVQTQPVAPVQPQPQAQPTGRVVMHRPPPIRSVPKDDQGYPIVPGMEPDPGEVALPDSDEDGVGQM